MEVGMENSESGGSLTTARHWPSQDRSAGPGGGDPRGTAHSGPRGHEPHVRHAPHTAHTAYTPYNPHTPYAASGAARPAHEHCDLVTVPARQGLEAVDILRRGAGEEAVGPVLHDGGGDTLGFLVPPGTAAAWDLPGSACTQTFAGAGTDAQDPVPPPPVAGTGWLVPPGETDPVTDPEALRAALGEARRMIEAADNCR
ncbi:hypothetical protein FH965_14875 [Streptomyces spectabilis]|uniref:Uncharacterized protein n=2 Tax=Streptomyces spectabilis TaxID=68270 RepID=A0A516RL23_STRST|nr:hypothetical protein FH965_14875 [Streptomyces spectabilis]